MKKLILLRGLPGSGKSTLAKTFDNAVHFEADMYFLDENSNYKFDASKLRDAHAWCQTSVGNAMIQNHTAQINGTIIVSNTFTQEWEMEPYIKMAAEWGYQVFTLIVENRHGGVNAHGVPEDKLQMMKERFELKLI